MKRLPSLISALFFCFSFSTDVRATQDNKLGFDTTRLVINEEQPRNAYFRFINKTEYTYLVSGAIYNALPDGSKSENRSAEFILTPPVTKSGPHTEKLLRVIRTGGDFPDDRESLFYFSASFVPGENKKTVPPGRIPLKIGYIWNMKVFYRPSGIRTAKVKDYVDKITVDNHQGKLRIKNNSPLWFTVVNFKTDADIKARPLSLIVGPYSSALLNSDEVSPVTGQKLKLQFIDEDGHHIPDGGKEYTVR